VANDNTSAGSTPASKIELRSGGVGMGAGAPIRHDATRGKATGGAPIVIQALHPNG